MIDIEVSDLYEALRLGSKGDTIPESVENILTRLLAMASAKIEVFAPDAPVAVKNEAAIRTVGWMYDSHRDDIITTSHFRSSGAENLLSEWRNITIGVADDA